MTDRRPSVTGPAVSRQLRRAPQKRLEKSEDNADQSAKRDEKKLASPNDRSGRAAVGSASGSTVVDNPVTSGSVKNEVSTLSVLK
jgi:hypothetical protein